MNAAQLQGIRNIHANMNRKPITAYEMALTSHNLNKSGYMATVTNGDRYIWDDAKKVWTPYQ